MAWREAFTSGQEHPEWVRKKFPTYVEHTHESLARSDRTLKHQGRTITTTYEVRVEGRLITLHMMVDEEGRLWSHLCPYLTFTSAPELVRHLLKRMPHLFEAPQATRSGGGAGGEPSGQIRGTLMAALYSSRPVSPMMAQSAATAVATPSSASRTARIMSARCAGASIAAHRSPGWNPYHPNCE